MRLVVLLCVLLGTCVADKHIYKEADAEQLTTSTTFQTAMTFSFTTNNNKQDFIISWTAEIYAANLAEAIDVRLMCDGMVLNQQDWHPNPDGPTGEGWAVATGWKFADLNAGLHTFTVEYRSTTSGQQVGVRRVRVMATPANAQVM